MIIRYKLITSILISISLQASSIEAAETRFGVDPRVDLNALAQSETPQAFSYRNGRNFLADASAVISADFTQLARASADYNGYVNMGMPHLRASHVVGQSGDDILYVWNWMAMSVMGFGQQTRHCFEVRFHRQLRGGAAGSQWDLHPCPSRAKFQLPFGLRDEYRDEPAFDYFNGSWYMKRVKVRVAGKNVERIYVRYYMSARPSNSLAGLVGGKILEQFKRGTKQVIQILAREAGSRP